MGSENILSSEALVQRFSVKKVLLEISQNSQEACNFIKKEALAQTFSCEFCEISKNTFFQRIPLVAASVCYCEGLKKFFENIE